MSEWTKHRYQAVFLEDQPEVLSCPGCGDTYLHPVGRAYAPEKCCDEYSPHTAIGLECEHCDEPMLLEIGNYKGNLAFNIVKARSRR